jgi:acyl-CoA reductase-like NAD-dependent aldehyde dehydrogenase
MILNASQLSALRQRNDEELRKGKYAKYGYPAHTIQDLLQTVEAIKKEKKKWQRLAQERGQTLRKIGELATMVKEP